MISSDQLNDVIGSTAYDSDGDKIGKIGNVYYDDDTDQPKWLTVHTGLFGGNETFVPVQGSELTADGNVTTSYDKGTVKDAPNVSEDGHLSREEEQQLYRHYNLTGNGTTDTVTGTEDVGRDSGTAFGDERRDRADTSVGVDHDRSEVVGHDTSGPTTDTAMTRSEEQLRVGTETRETGQARLRKHIVTENVSTTVPVSHEEVTLEREPISEVNRDAALSGGDLTEEEHEVTLHEERAVTQKDVVPVERVRLGTETVSGTEQVEDTVRKEVVETDGVEDVRGDRRVAEDVRGDREVAGDVRGDREVVEDDRLNR